MLNKNYAYFVEYLDADTHNFKCYFYPHLTEKDAQSTAEKIKKEGHLAVMVVYKPQPATPYPRRSYKREDF